MDFINYLVELKKKKIVGQTNLKKFTHSLLIHFCEINKLECYHR